MQWKKIVAAGSLSFLMAGSTIALAQLENYPSPFVTSDGADVLVVVGASAAPSDVVGAVDVAARLGGEVTTNVPVPGSVGIATVSGEGRSVHTANEKVYLDNNLKKTGLRTSMSDTDLPTLLKSGTVSDSDAGTTYDFDQFIDFSDDFNLTYNKVSGDLPDPTYFFGELGTSATTTSYFVRSRVVFNDEVNSTTVVGEKINLFGNKYTFASGTTAVAATPVVELFGGSDTRTMAEGETLEITIDNIAYSVKLLVVSSATTVGVQVGTDSKSIDKGKSATVGGLEVFVDDVFFTSKEGTVSSSSLLLGARRLIITNATQVKTKTGGESEKTIDGTLGVVTVSGGKLTGIDIYYVGQDSRKDFLKAGGMFDNPVWKTFNLAFSSLSVDAKSDARDKLELTPSGTKDLNLVFTSDRGDRGTVKWGHINSSTQTTVFLQDDNADRVVVVEGQPVQRNHYFVVDAGDFSRIFELTSLSSLGTADAKAEIRDVMSGKAIEVKFIEVGNTRVTKVIDGQQYFFQLLVNNTDNPNLIVTWGDGAAYNSTGGFLSVFPRLKTKSGGFVSFGEAVTLGPTISQRNFANGTKLQLPTGAVTLSWNDTTTGSTGNGLTITAATTERGDASALNGTIGIIGEDTTRFFRLGKTASGWGQYRIINTDVDTITISMARSASVADGNATVLLVEEQDDNSDIHTVLFTGVTETRSGNEETSVVNPPMFSYREQKGDTGYSGATSDANSDLVQLADFWGTYVEVNTKDQNRAWAWYPDDQVYANVFVLENDATVSTSTGVAGGSIKSATPIKTALGKLDSEVTSADKSTKNLVLVGGPAVNTLVADLARAGKTRDTDWYRAQGVGTALLDYVASAFTTGKAALVVAGHSAGDTRVATGWLQDFGAHSSDLMGARVVLKNGVKTTAAV